MGRRGREGVCGELGNFRGVGSKYLFWGPKRPPCECLIYRGGTNRVFGKPYFCPVPQRGRFDGNGKNDEFAFYPLKTRASLVRPPKTTKTTRMEGVTQAKAWFRKSLVCPSLNVITFLYRIGYGVHSVAYPFSMVTCTNLVTSACDICTTKLMILQNSCFVLWMVQQ